MANGHVNIVIGGRDRLSSVLTSAFKSVKAFADGTAEGARAAIAAFRLRAAALKDSLVMESEAFQRAHKSALSAYETLDEISKRVDAPRDAIQLDLSDTVPVIVTDENVTKLRVDNVMDLAEERPMNLIHGQHVFRVAGFNMVLTDEGAAAYLENALGTTFPLVIDEVVSKQLFKAHTAELLPGGDYKLVVKSRAGDAGGPLQTSFRKVKYLRVVDPGPTVTKINADNTFQAGGGNIVTGANMRFANDDPGGALVIKDPDGTEVSAMIATDEQVPVTESRFGLSINGDFMAEREYTFEFTMIGADGQPVLVSKKATFVE